MKTKAKILIKRLPNEQYTIILKTQWLRPFFDWYILNIRLVDLSCEEMNMQLKKWKEELDVEEIITI